MANERLAIRVSERGSRRVARNVASIGTSARGAAGSVKALVLSLAPLAAIVGIGLGLGAVVRTLRDFEQAMSTVEAITGATGAQFELLTQKARELGATTRFSATEAADGMTFLARAGFEVDEIFKSIGPTLDLAQAGALGLARAADISSNILKGFRLEAEEMTRVVDVLAATANMSNTSVEQLGEAMKFAAPIAAGLNVSIETTAAALGTLGDAGIQGTLAGTALRTIMLELVNPTEQARNALRLLNLEVSDVNVETQGLVKVLQNFKAQGAGIQEIAQIISRRGVAPLAVLIEAADDLENFDIALNNVEGTAKRVSEIMDQNLNGALLQVRSAFQELIIAFKALDEDSLVNRGFRFMAQIIRDIAAILPFIGIEITRSMEIASNIVFSTGATIKLVFDDLVDDIKSSFVNAFNFIIMKADEFANAFVTFGVTVAQKLDIFGVLKEEFEQIQKDLVTNPIDLSDALLAPIKNANREELRAEAARLFSDVLTRTPKADAAAKRAAIARDELAAARQELALAERQKEIDTATLQLKLEEANRNFALVVSLDQLKAAIDPVFAAERKFAAAERTLIDAGKARLVGLFEQIRLYKILKDRLEDVRNPLRVFLRDTDIQIKSLSGLARLQKEENQILEAQKALRGDITKNSVNENRQIRERIQLLTQLARASQTQLEIDDRFNKATQDAIFVRQEAQRLLRAGIITQKQANVAILEAGIAADKAALTIRGVLSGSLKELQLEFMNVQDAIGVTLVNSFKNAEDALVSFVTTGKLDFKQFADSIIQDLARIAVRQAILGPLLGGLGSLFNFGGKGAAFSNAVTTARGTGFLARGGIINSPTLLGGNKIGGESGPEGVLPLKRLPSGDLGVQATGSGSVVIGAGAVQINVASRGNENDPELAQRIGRAVEKSLRSLVTGEISNQQRPGGRLNPQVTF